VLGDIVAGVNLHGSLALNDDRPGRGDLDPLIVAQNPLTDAQLVGQVGQWSEPDIPAELLGSLGQLGQPLGQDPPGRLAVGQH
jgi:hypothetical protein